MRTTKRRRIPTATLSQAIATKKLLATLHLRIDYIVFHTEENNDTPLAGRLGPSNEIISEMCFKLK